MTRYGVHPEYHHPPHLDTDGYYVPEAWVVIDRHARDAEVARFASGHAAYMAAWALTVGDPS